MEVSSRMGRAQARKSTGRDGAAGSGREYPWVNSRMRTRMRGKECCVKARTGRSLGLRRARPEGHRIAGGLHSCQKWASPIERL